MAGIRYQVSGIGGQGTGDRQPRQPTFRRPLHLLFQNLRVRLWLDVRLLPPLSDTRPLVPDTRKWQARRESNPQPAVLETAALPIELLAFSGIRYQRSGIRRARRGCTRFSAALP